MKTPFIKMKLAKITEDSLVYGIERALRKITPEFKDTSELDENIYTADVFDNIRVGFGDVLDKKSKEQLDELIISMKDIDYVLISKS